MSDRRERVVILGGGFGGLFAAQRLRGAPVAVTLIDRTNYHLFQPLLYQVATGGLSPADVATPLRAILKRQANARVLLAEATDLDPLARRVILSDGEVGYDSLIVACGAGHHYFGHPEWERLAPGLKTIEDATEIRRRILVAFEAAERELDAGRRRAWLTFVVVGGGPTGVELAGTLGEIANHTLRSEFRTANPRDARILLIESDGRVLPPYAPDLSARAEKSLARLGVTVWTDSLVTAIEPGGVTVKRGNESVEVATRNVIWAAGVQASRFGQVLRERAGAELDRAGRVVVGPDLSIPGHPEIMVIGDQAAARDENGAPLPGLAPVAIQEGRYAAERIRRRLDGRPPPAPFRYREIGMMATIGRGAAVARLGRLRLAGYPAWLAWLFVHLMALVEFENRVLVFIQWAWNYLTWSRGARLIVGKSPLPLERAPGVAPGSRPSEPPDLTR